MKKHYVSNSETSTRMFDSGILEAVSKVHFTVPLLVFIPVICYCVYHTYISTVLSIPNIIIYFILGLLVWTMTEYVLHRFIFHFEPKTAFGKRCHFIFHGVHHDYPKDRLRLVLPPIISIPLATMFYLIFSNSLTGAEFYPFFAAFITGYIIYDMLHYAIHHVQVKGKLWNILKTHHLKHHYVYPEKGYGVSSPIWDKLAKTEFPKESKSYTKSA